MGHETPPPAPARAALRLADLTLLLLDARGAVAATLPLEGRSFEAAVRWLAEELGRLRGAPLAKPLLRPPYELPDHPVAAGRAFQGAPEAQAELARWFEDADALLREVAGRQADASPVRCWPHHFDIATLVGLGAAPDGTPSTIGVGLSPGDAFYPEPYWYVSPYPHPDAPDLPHLPAGARWHTEGWLGAVLPGTALVAAGGAAAQARCARAFIDAALEAGRTLALGGLAGGAT